MLLKILIVLFIIIALLFSMGSMLYVIVDIIMEILASRKKEPEPQPEPEPETVGYRTYINLGLVDEIFSEGEVVSLEALKDKKLVPKKVKRIKILADGEITKALVFEAHGYSREAIKKILEAGGTVINLR